MCPCIIHIYALCKPRFSFVLIPCKHIGELKMIYRNNPGLAISTIFPYHVNHDLK